MIQFFVSCDPPRANHQRKKIVKVGKFLRLADTDELVKARATWETVILPHRKGPPVMGPVSLTLEFTWAWPSGTSKRVRDGGRAPKVTSPDCDNLAKGVTDCLSTLRFIGNDATVAELVVRKFFGDEPGLLVRIVAMEGYLA